MFDHRNGFEVVHLIGIGGIGMSALAHFLLDRGAHVTGSDIKGSGIIDRLIRRGAKISIGHDPSHIGRAKVVVYSTATLSDNVEMYAALHGGCVLLHRSELLELISHDSMLVGITGAHGKTTTSCLIAHLWANLDPSYILGGECPNFPAHGHCGTGPFFVAEIDESDGSFANTGPSHLVINSLDIDHIEFWINKERLIESYHALARRTQGFVLLYLEEGEKAPFSHSNLFTYGFHPEADFVVQSRAHALTLTLRGKELGTFNTPLFGRHNIQNAAAALSLHFLVMGRAADPDALSSFRGVLRRMEQIGSSHVFTDYAHHPKEIAPAAATFLDRFPDAVFVFEPHRASRLNVLLDDFIVILKKVRSE